MENCYIKDPQISTIQGYPFSSRIPYLPPYVKRHNELLVTGIDLRMQKLCSGLLYSAQESILYNYYLKYNIYRFLWIRSFYSQIVISLSDGDSGIMLETIKLEFSGSGDGAAIILSDETKYLTISDWEEFERQLENCSFWSMQPCIDNEGYARDGSSWLIEGHLKEKYWFVSRDLPDTNLSNIAEFLINKSGMDEIIIKHP